MFKKKIHSLLLPKHFHDENSISFNLARPKAKDVLRHHVFWSSETRISFLCDTSDKVGNIKRTNLYQELERARYAVMEGIWEGKAVKTWDKRIHHNIISYMNDYRKQKHNQGYDFSSVRELVRFIRNMAVHYEKLSLDVQVQVVTICTYIYIYNVYEQYLQF